MRAWLNIWTAETPFWAGKETERTRKLAPLWLKYREEAFGDEDIAVVDEKICIGCGVCTPTCEPEAVELTLRAEANPPPDLTEFLTVRYKQG